MVVYFDGHIFPISMSPVYNLQELCDEVSVLGKHILKLAERPPSGNGEAHHISITPHSAISLSPSSCVCMCVYSCVSMCVCVHVWQSCEKRREWADTGKRLHILSKLQYPNCKVSLIYFVG